MRERGLCNKFIYECPEVRNRMKVTKGMVNGSQRDLSQCTEEILSTYFMGEPYHQRQGNQLSVFLWALGLKVLKDYWLNMSFQSEEAPEMVVCTVAFLENQFK